MAGFIFGGDTGTTAEDLARKRKIIDALRANSVARMPTNVGEGIYSLGTALIGRMKDRKLDPLEDQERARVTNQFEAITNSIMGGGQPSYTPAPVAPVSASPLTAPEQIGADAMAAIGQPSQGGYRESLIGTESGGRWDARNNETGAGGKAGHFGRVQFGHARLQDAMNAGAIPQGTTPEQFMASPELQMAAENWHFADLERELAPLVGSVVNGQTLDMGALVAMGHLGGAGGARKFVESGGQYNPSDSFGTSLAEYAATHGGQGGGAAPQPTPAQGQPQAQIVAQLAELAQNPYMSDTQKAIVQQLLGQQMQAPDPMAAIELERAQLELEQLRNPQAKPADLPSSVQEYQFYAAQAEANGETPMTYADFLVADEKAGAGTGGPAIGTIPQGFTAIPDPAEPSGFRMERIAGGPEDTTATDAQAASNAQIASDVVTTAAADARAAAEDRIATGVFGRLASVNPSTQNAEVYRQVDTLKSMAVVSNLQAMRDASPTGGALGAVTAPELKMLEVQSGALDPQSPNFARDLDRYERTLLRTIHGKEEGDRVYEATRKPVTGETGAAPTTGQTLTYNPATGEFE